MINIEIIYQKKRLRQNLVIVSQESKILGILDIVDGKESRVNCHIVDPYTAMVTHMIGGPILARNVLIDTKNKKQLLMR